MARPSPMTRSLSFRGYAAVKCRKRAIHPPNPFSDGRNGLLVEFLQACYLMARDCFAFIHG